MMIWLNFKLFIQNLELSIIIFQLLNKRINALSVLESTLLILTNSIK